MYKLVALALIAASITAADAVVARTAACPADELCLSCGSDKKCTLCAYGYPNTAGICQFPTEFLDDCYTYSSATACQGCDEGYYLKSNACVAITITDCVVVNSTDNTKCAVCDNGKYPSAAGTCTDGTACPSTLTNCDKCASATVCVDCKANFSLSNNACVAETVDNCAQLNGANCVRCEPDYYAADNTCKATSAQESSYIFSAVVAFLVFAKLMA